MRAVSPPTRRTLKQQTLHAMVTSPPPIALPASADSDNKRTTRQSPKAADSLPPPTENTAPPLTSATPSPRRGRPRTPRSSSLPIVRTPQLRPRRSPSSGVGLRGPYEQYPLEMLRDECKRRGLSTQTREQDSAKGTVRGKIKFVELLQEADMLVMFERQSQKKTGRRTARAVRLTPPPAPIRVTSGSVTTPRRAPKVRGVVVSMSTSAAPTESVPLPSTAPIPDPTSTVVAPLTTALALDSTATSPTIALASDSQTPTARVKGRKKAKRLGPPPSRKKAVRLPTLSDEPTVATTVESLSEQSMTTQSTPQLVATPWISSAAEVQGALGEAPVAEEDKPAAPLTVTEQEIVLPVTVDLTGDAPIPITDVHTPIRLDETNMSMSSQHLTDASASRQEVHFAPPKSRPANQTVARRPNAKQPIRARRGCRFRLINVVLSPDFNTRWSEMKAPVMSQTEVNTFWRDVHISFLCQNSFYDEVHFEDALFESVTPNVIQNHTAQKLQQMWTEIVATYRRVHNTFLKSVEKEKVFLDFCAGRLDLLYLHMALVLEPELHKLVVSEIPRSKVVSGAGVTQGASGTAPKAHAQHDATGNEQPQLAVSSGGSLQDSGPRFVELQNPEMLPDWLLEDQAKTAAERGELYDAEPNWSQVQQIAQPATTHSVHRASKRTKAAVLKAKKAEAAPKDAPAAAQDAEQPAPVQTRDLVLHSSAINSIDDSASSDYETSEPNQTAPTTRRRAPGKRRRKSSSADLVELPSSRELVPHPHKRMHTAVTTTMTRSQELVVPPDEFDVQTNRLRKINESIEQCYRTLANPDAILNDMHREDVESDLRFYLGIKKRIQEQLVMFMHGF